MLLEGTVESAMVKFKIICRHCHGAGKIRQSQYVYETCDWCEGMRIEWVEEPLLDFLIAAGVVFVPDGPYTDAVFPKEQEW